MRRVLPALIAVVAVVAVVAVLAACNSSTGPDADVTGTWSGTWVTTIPAGPTEPWSGTLAQSGTAVTGSVSCQGIETYTVTGTNVQNTLTLVLVGTLADTARFNGAASANNGVSASGTFNDNDGAGCFSGYGSWTGKVQ